MHAGFRALRAACPMNLRKRYATAERGELVAKDVARIVHDVLDAHGFDAPGGNFQVNNYGKGGLGNDDVRAEAQDGSGRNNANFGTNPDGQRPRMQMFEWRSSAPNPIVVQAPSPIAGTYFGPMAGFGESLLTTGPISGQVIYVGRGCDPAYQAGQPLDPYPATWAAGKIALIDRGSCTFVAKVKKAQDLDAAYLLSLDPDRMLAFYRKRAGLPQKAEGYTGWDADGRQLTGHIAGHHLSAVSLMYAATGDARFKPQATC